MIQPKRLPKYLKIQKAFCSFSKLAFNELLQYTLP
jgi:hypothetical protein